MTYCIPTDLPSLFFQKQINSISIRMSSLTAQSILKPLQNMKDFDRLNETFALCSKQANDLCATLDKTYGSGRENKTLENVINTMGQMIVLRNQANAMMQADYVATLPMSSAA